MKSTPIAPCFHENSAAFYTSCAVLFVLLAGAQGYLHSASINSKAINTFLLSVSTRTARKCYFSQELST